MKTEFVLGPNEVAIDLRIKHISLFTFSQPAAPKIEGESEKFDIDADETIPEDSFLKLIPSIATVNGIYQPANWWRERSIEEMGIVNRELEKLSQNFTNFSIPYSEDATPFCDDRFGYFAGENFTRKTFLSDGSSVTFLGLRYEDMEKLNAIKLNPNLTEAQKVAKVATRMIAEISDEKPIGEYFKVAELLERPILDALIFRAMEDNFFRPLRGE